MGLTIHVSDTRALHFGPADELRESENLKGHVNPEDVFAIAIRDDGANEIQVYPLTREESELLFRHLGRAFGYEEQKA
ncbi:MAG TPA: hypothetical protein VIY27_09065 [Myxococcota bacterium]